MRYRPQDFVIACDMDDTIEYLLPAWIRWLNAKYGYNTKYSDVTDWRVRLAFPGLTDDQVFEPLQLEEFWKTVEPMWDAVYYIKKLIDEGFPFYIVTSSYPDSILPKFTHVLYKYFPFIDKHNIIIAHKKQMIHCDMLIDDGTHNIVGPYIGLLKDTPHNRWFKEKDIKNIYRVYCWKQIYEKIHEIIDQ